jgi:hypothetical protein
MNPIVINPYKFRGDWNKFYTTREDGWYNLDETVLIQLRIKPKQATCGDNWLLSADGDLLLTKGFRWNGANVVQDAPCKMLASAVHDVLCEDDRAYSYYRRQKMFRDICIAQGSGWLLSSVDFLGVLAGQWWPPWR